MPVFDGILGEAAESVCLADDISVASADYGSNLELPAPAASGVAPEVVVSPVEVAPPAWLASIGCEDGMDDTALRPTLCRELLASRQYGGARVGCVPY